MLKEKLSELILETMKTKDTVRREVLRAIKTEIQKFETAEGAIKDDSGKVIYTEVDEINILKRLLKQRLADAEEYKKALREDLANEELDQAKIIESFLPKPTTAEEITAEFNELCKTIEPVKKNMGSFIKSIKARFPAADGKLVASIVGSRLS